MSLFVLQTWFLNKQLFVDDKCWYRLRIKKMDRRCWEKLGLPTKSLLAMQALSDPNILVELGLWSAAPEGGGRRWPRGVETCILKTETFL